MNKNIISQQLNAASKMIQTFEGTELYTSVLDVCGALVNMVSEQICCNEIDNENAKDITSCVTFISKGIENISKTACETDCLKVSTESVKKLEKALAEQQELIEKEQNARKELNIIEYEIKLLEPKVEALEKNFNFQNVFKQSLEKSIEEFSDEKINELESLNNRLVNELAMKQKAYEELINKQNEHNQKIAAFDKQIAAMPEEKQLVDEYDKKDTYYKRLLTAKDECSEEKQLELQEKIAELENTVNGLEEAMTLLEKRRNEIADAKTKIETQKGIFETDFIQKLEDSMDDLKNHMRSHRVFLNGIKDDATELKKHIEECNNIYKNYSFMFDTCKVPLEAIANASKMEYEELSKHYDITLSKHVNQLKADIQEKITELGRIIDECTKAVTADQASLKGKAFGKDT